MQLPGLLICVLLFTVVGAIDDIIRLKAAEKLLLQLLAAAITTFAIQPNAYLENAWIIFWLILITNAFNLIDGMDGLAISYAAVVFGWSIWVNGPDDLTCTLLGACIGFMPFNLYHAKFYLGDSGSHALGSAIGYLTVPLVAAGEHLAIADLITITLPLADILFVTITRTLRRSGVTTGGTDHIAHRLARLVGASAAVPVLISTSLLLALLSLKARTVSPGLQAGFVLVLWADVIFAITRIERRTRRFFS